MHASDNFIPSMHAHPFFHFINCWYYTMQILDKEAVEEVRAKREIHDIKSEYIVQLKVVWRIVSKFTWSELCLISSQDI